MNRAGRSYPYRPWIAALWTGLLALVLPCIVHAADLPTVTANDLESGFPLEGGWHRKGGDSLAWASPEYDATEWPLYEVPSRWEGNGFPESKQMVWYRLNLQLAPDALGDAHFDKGYGLQMGKVMSAYELFANGKLVGSAGRLPPLSAPHYDEHKVFFLPRNLVGPDGRLELALRVWGGSDEQVRLWGGGPYGGKFVLGDYPKLINQGVAAGIPSLILCALFLAFGANLLYLYWRNQQLKLYLWFGLTAIHISIYSLLLSQWKFLLPISFASMKTLEFALIFALPAVATQMIWAMLDNVVPRWLRAYQLSFLVFVFLAITNPWTETKPFALQVFQFWVLPILFVVPWFMFRAMQAGNTEVRTMFLGLLTFGLTCVNDILIDLVRLDSPRMIHYGFAAVMIAMVVSVGNRFTAMLNRLEREVAEHTEELRQANFQLSLVARMDPLTGLLNRRGFIEDAEKEIQRVNRGSPGFSLILADIDHFKSINDEHGHNCGDEVLRRVAGLLLQRLREVDVVGRWGGEEFIIVLPETDSEGAAVVAEYLRIAVETALFQYHDEPLRFTMTFGIATHIKSETLDATVMRADAALYQGKDKGRNRVVSDDFKGLSAIP